MDREAIIRSGETMQKTGNHNGTVVQFPGAVDPVKGGVGDVNSDAKGSAARYNGGKPPIELIPARWIAWYYDKLYSDPRQSDAVGAMYALARYQDHTTGASALIAALQYLGDDGWIECAQVFEYGRRKYAEWNWAKGMKWSIPHACAMRHLIAIAQGQHTDPESGLPHRGHVFCNIVMLLQYQVSYRSGDDRPPAGLLLPQPEGEAVA